MGETKKRTTTELLMELEHAEHPDDFLRENEAELKGISVSEFLNEMLVRHSCQKKEVIGRAGIGGETYVYQLFDGRKEKPSRDKLVQLAFGFPLTVDEVRTLLHCANYQELSPRIPREAYILFALQRGMTLADTNEMLIKNGHASLEWGIK